MWEYPSLVSSVGGRIIDRRCCARNDLFWPGSQEMNTRRKDAKQKINVPYSLGGEGYDVFAAASISQTISM